VVYGGNHDRWLDLRVDHSDGPIEDLRSLFELHTLYFGRTSEMDLLPFDNGRQAAVKGMLEAAGWWDVEASLEDNLQAWLGWHNLEERWVGMDRVDPVVLQQLSEAGR
jgi:uncharacterized Ntn-hydrolase superfamily protein